MRRAKRHHIVPQVLQRSFCGESRNLWYSTRSENGTFLRPERRSTERCFWKRDYYTTLVEEKPSDVVEKVFYGGIDNYLGRLLPEIENSFGHGRILQFSGEALLSLQDVNLEMAKRTPDFVTGFDDLEVGERYLQEILAAYTIQGDEEEVKRIEGELADDRMKRLYGRDIRNGATLQPSVKSSRLLN